MRKLITLVGVLLLLIGIGAIAAGYLVWSRLHQPYRGFEHEAIVDIPAGSSPRDIGRRLTDAGVIRDSREFLLAAWWRDDTRRLKAGEYRFTAPASPLAVVDRLARGDVFLHRITFREGLTIDEKAAVYEARGFGSAEAFREAAGQAALIADLDPAAPDLEGYLFPETYAVPRGTTASRLVAMMVDRFRAVYDEDLRERAAAQGLTTRDVVTLASIVEKEAGLADERPLVAAVFRNRLRIGMGMQADPTVIYALQRAGRYDGNIRRADLQFDSPYNTYRYPGLPPGPIAAPGRASLAATLSPADVRYLYFVSRNDGSHIFSETYAEHRRNVQEWQVQYFQRR